MHVKLEKELYNSSTGEKVSKPYIQKFNVKAWNLAKQNVRRLGFTSIEVLYSPKK